MPLVVPIVGAWYVSLLAVLFVLVCLFMMLVILIQKPRGGGLSGAFGGAGGSSQAAFGAKVGDVLTWFTVVCFVAFLSLAMVLTWTLKPDKSEPAIPAIAPPAQTTGGGGAPAGSVPAATVPATPAPGDRPADAAPPEQP
jgi:preprotein translocase subunit SecG